MRCVYCNCEETRVVDSRPTEGNAIRRRRECPECNRRFTTYEKVETPPILVIKKDGSRQLFDPNKVRQGIIKACEKRPVTSAQIDQLVSEIEKQLNNSLNEEVMSNTIGEMVMKGLKELDDVAYVRFASVYRQFKDINTFMQELNKLLNDG
ncbi:MAG TPA: transcriptional regulator NrdR [Clostridia bacterium]|nr:transcriptional regulator NrdR [Clostridia bacterium]